jgi:hypothetical protein
MPDLNRHPARRSRRLVAQTVRSRADPPGIAQPSSRLGRFERYYQKLQRCHERVHKRAGPDTPSMCTSLLIYLEGEPSCALFLHLLSLD